MTRIDGTVVGNSGEGYVRVFIIEIYIHKCFLPNRFIGDCFNCGRMSIVSIKGKGIVPPQNLPQSVQGNKNRVNIYAKTQRKNAFMQDFA